MALSNFQRTIVDDAGNVIPNATVTVRVNDSSGALASLFTDRAGTTPASNPISADGEGFVRFYVAGGRYYIKAEGASSEIEWEDYLIGTMQGQDSDDVDITGGDIAGADITGGTVNGAAVSGGTINNTPIGGTTASTGEFTTVSASTSVTTPLITRAGNIELSATGANLLDFKTNGQDRMRITSSGNVGIGTTAPAEALHVVGRTRLPYLQGEKSVSGISSGTATTVLSIPEHPFLSRAVEVSVLVRSTSGEVARAAKFIWTTSYLSSSPARSVLRESIGAATGVNLSNRNITDIVGTAAKVGTNEVLQITATHAGAFSFNAVFNVTFRSILGDNYV